MPKIRYLVKSAILYDSLDKAETKLLEILDLRKKRNETIVQIGIEEVISHEELR